MRGAHAERRAEGRRTLDHEPVVDPGIAAQHLCEPVQGARLHGDVRAEDLVREQRGHRSHARRGKAGPDADVERWFSSGHEPPRDSKPSAGVGRTLKACPIDARISHPRSIEAIGAAGDFLHGRRAAAGARGKILSPTPRAGARLTGVLASRDGYEIDDDPARLDLEVVHRFLSEESYWAKGRSREAVERAVAGSLNFGLYKGTAQVGFTRVVTDRSTFAWICDVFVLPEHRGRRLGHWLIETMLAHPDLQGLR